jgi:hypothetical protein
MEGPFTHSKRRRSTPNLTSSPEARLIQTHQSVSLNPPIHAESHLATPESESISETGPFSLSRLSPAVTVFPQLILPS